VKLRTFLTLVITGAVASVLAVASPAVAKGTSTVTVKGPGVARPIALDGEGTLKLNEAAGLYHAVFHASGSVIVSRRPNGKLGPRYVATYAWLVGPNRTKPVRQELYPFASGGAWTYTPPGQRVLKTETPFLGGWYRAGPPLTDLLVSIGVPASAADQRS
jgi:hypothetical protein